MKQGAGSWLDAPLFVLAGMVVALFPHLYLPLRYIEGFAGALVRQICLLRFHPEFYLGMAIVLTGIIRGIVRSRSMLLVILAEGGLLIYQGLSPKPVSYYAGKSEAMIVLANYQSIISHVFYRGSLVTGGLILSASALYLYVRPKRMQVGLSFPKIAARNIQRRSFRNMLIAGLWALATVSIFLAVFFYFSASRGLRQAISRLNSNIIVYPANSKRPFQNFDGPYIPPGRLRRLASIEGVRRVTGQLDVGMEQYSFQGYRERHYVIGFQPGNDFVVLPNRGLLLSGTLGPRDVIIGDRVKFYPGQRVRVMGKEFHVHGMLKEAGADRIDRAIYLPMESAVELIGPTLGPGTFSRIFIDIDDGVSADAVIERIRRLFPGLSALSAPMIREEARGQLLRAFKWLMVAAISICLAGGLIGMQVIMMMISERQGELSILRALGAGGRDMTRVLGWEYGMVIGGGVLSGIIASFSLVGLLQETFRELFLLEVPFEITAPVMAKSAVASAAVIIGVSVLSFWVLQRSVLKRDILDGIRAI